MSKDKINMPMSGAGITRYFEDFKSRLDMRPMHVVILCIIIALLILLLHVFGKSFLS